METRRYFEIKKNREKRILLVWVPSHIGIKGNKIANNLAKTRTKEESTIELKVPFSHLKEQYKNEGRRKTRNQNNRENEWKGKNVF